MHARLRVAQVVGLGLAAGLIVTACSGSDTDAGGAGQSVNQQESLIRPGPVGDQQPAGPPVEGGTLDIAVPIEAYSLDPAEIAGMGVLGGHELIAIYDTLVRYNPKTGEYEPRLAKTLEHNADFTTWTLTLRPDVSFSDGTPVDAAAVKFSINRYIAKEGFLASTLEHVLETITTPDPRTVVFQLGRAWSRFPFLLANTPGMIVSPAAARKWGDELTSHPVGAGAFVLERYAPHEEIVLTANPDYWGGRPHLDKLRFVPIPEGQTQLETLNTGGIDVAVLDDPEAVAEAVEQDYSGHMYVVSATHILVINNRSGRPGSDPRVRKAIAYAIDPEVYDQRAFEGKGVPGKALFHTSSRWRTDPQTTPYDPGKAQQLVARAKQDGYDGKISLLYTQPTEDQALTVKAMLDAVGFTVTLDSVRTTQDLIREARIERQFDLAFYGWRLRESAPYELLYHRVARPDNFMGHQDKRMNSLIEELRAAGTAEAKRSLVNDIQQVWAETVPSVILGGGAILVAWDKDVHGPVPTASEMVFFDEAWISSR